MNAAASIKRMGKDACKKLHTSHWINGRVGGFQSPVSLPNAGRSPPLLDDTVEARGRPTGLSTFMLPRERADGICSQREPLMGCFMPLEFVLFQSDGGQTELPDSLMVSIRYLVA